MHSADSIGVWCHYPRLTLLLNYVMLSSLHLLYMVSTHHYHTNAAAMQAFVWLNSRLMVTLPCYPVPDQRLFQTSNVTNTYQI